MKLVIVESPTKAKTIAKFLGKKYTVKSSYGHIRDLPEKKMGIDIENDFQPDYVIPTKAIERVDNLKTLAEKADEIILASDEDREGEAIAWHLSSALNLDPKTTKRIVFHEITKSAIEKALDNPRAIDLNLVDAQQARRILDRLVGFELSPFLWKKIRRGLSAGRVQSVALRLIVEREKEIEKFKAEKFWVIDGKFQAKNGGSRASFNASLLQKNGEKIDESITLKLFAGDYKTKKTNITTQKMADTIVAELQSSVCQIVDIVKKETLRTPPAPFTTSTLQQGAINSLGFSSKQTMMAAQKLYEQGLITYMRTDSTNLSMESMLSAQKTITKLFGKEYALPTPRFYKTKSKNAQEAHEAIRPAYPEKTPAELESSLEPSQYKIYRLIWNRMIASQMQPAKFDSVKMDIEAKAEKNIYLLRANGSTLLFEGYLKVYSDQAITENILPALEKNDPLDLISATATAKSTTQPPRYSEATLIKVMEENGIGRPSTYAPTITTIIERKYVEKNEERRLFPLEIGTLVSDLLVAHFTDIVDIKFTANIEEEFDKIADGRSEWVPIIRNFYEPFHKNLLAKTKKVSKEDFQEKLGRNCPDCGGDLIMKFGRFGKFIACTNYPECKYTEKTETEKKIDAENSHEICEICGAPMVVKRGRFGAFLGCSNYPECKGIKKIENKTGIKCPRCDAGDIVERKSKRGRIFFGCNSYPKCDFALWNKPTGEKCPLCQSLLVFAAKNKVRCSSKECKFEKENPA
ncbi:MAG: type I DNA topoisomerase [Parcubacteria group bacterium]